MTGAQLADVLKRLDGSIGWLRDGKPCGAGIGVADMLLIRAALAAAPAPAEPVALENIRLYAARHRKEDWAATVLRFLSEAGVKGSPLRDAPKATEKDINRWQALIQERPAGPWEMGNGGSFDRTTIKPISDDMLEELAHWLSMGYTPWNARSMPLSDRDRQFMYLLYYSVQGLVSRMRAAEKAALSAPAQQPAQPAVKDSLTVQAAQPPACKVCGQYGPADDDAVQVDGQWHLTDCPLVPGQQAAQVDDHGLKVTRVAAEQLVALAASAGMVITMTQAPLQPFAMGHYRTVVEVRPARVLAKGGV